MTAIYFALGIAVMFGMLLVSEASSEDRNNISLRPASLLQWLISGNWPAKVGALLLIIGTGALLRYLMQQIRKMQSNLISRLMRMQKNIRRTVNKSALRGLGRQRDVGSNATNENA